jgi:hypothetical protein
MVAIAVGCGFLKVGKLHNADGDLDAQLGLAHTD